MSKKGPKQITSVPYSQYFSRTVRGFPSSKLEDAQKQIRILKNIERFVKCDTLSFTNQEGEMAGAQSLVELWSKLLECIDVSKMDDARNTLAFDFICQLLTRLEFDIIHLLPPGPGSVSPKARPLPQSFLTAQDHLRVAQLYRDQLIATMMVVFDLMRERLRRLEAREKAGFETQSHSDIYNSDGSIDLRALENLDLDQPSSISRAGAPETRTRERSSVAEPFEDQMLGDGALHNKLLVKFIVKTLAVAFFRLPIISGLLMDSICGPARQQTQLITPQRTLEQSTAAASSSTDSTNSSSSDAKTDSKSGTESKNARQVRAKSESDVAGVSSVRGVAQAAAGLGPRSQSSVFGFSNSWNTTLLSELDDWVTSSEAARRKRRNQQASKPPVVVIVPQKEKERQRSQSTGSEANPASILIMPPTRKNNAANRGPEGQTQQAIYLANNPSLFEWTRVDFMLSQAAAAQEQEKKDKDKERDKERDKDKEQTQEGSPSPSSPDGSLHKRGSSRQLLRDAVMMRTRPVTARPEELAAALSASAPADASGVSSLIISMAQQPPPATPSTSPGSPLSSSVAATSSASPTGTLRSVKDKDAKDKEREKGDSKGELSIQQRHALLMQASNFELVSRTLADNVLFFDFVHTWLSHILETSRGPPLWSLIPGYWPIAQAFLRRMVADPQCLFLPSGVVQKIQKQLLRNRECIECLSFFVQTLLRTTSIHDLQGFNRGIDKMDEWFLVLGDDLARPFPENFCWDILFRALNVCFDSEHFQILIKTLTFVYIHASRFYGPQRVRLMESLVLHKRYFAKLFLHWCIEVRRVYHYLIVYRIRRSGFFEPLQPPSSSTAPSASTTTTASTTSTVASTHTSSSSSAPIPVGSHATQGTTIAASSAQHTPGLSIDSAESKDAKSTTTTTTADGKQTAADAKSSPRATKSDKEKDKDKEGKDKDKDKDKDKGKKEKKLTPTRAFLGKISNTLSSFYTTVKSKAQNAMESASSPGAAGSGALVVDESFLLPGDPAPEACILIRTQMTQEEIDLDTKYASTVASYLSQVKEQKGNPSIHHYPPRIMPYAQESLTELSNYPAPFRRLQFAAGIGRGKDTTPPLGPVADGQTIEARIFIPHLVFEIPTDPTAMTPG